MSPLAPLRTIPMSMKRPFDEISDSRKKQRNNSTIAHTLETQFKVPALPIRRALTPSTSTVAASSSPPRLSSPARDDMESVEIVPGTSLIFGRHRHRPDPSSSEQPASSSIHLRGSIPTHLHHLVTDLDSPTSIIYLSRYASHASRTHALVEYDEEKDGLKVLVIGQNGMKIGGKRVLAGQRVEIPRRERVFLDFYGTRVGLIFPEKVQEAVGDLNMLFTPSSPERLSLPPSSPPLEPVDDVEMEEPIRHASPLFSRDSSPLSAPSDDEDEIPDPVSDPASEMSELAEDEAEGESGQLSSVESRELTPPPRSQSREKSVKREMLETVEVSDPVPDGIDLAALLASTVVFSGSSKLSLPDLVKHMLDSQPSLREKGEESRWLNWAGGVLENNPMFGKVQRHGKDSSGHPLLPHFFYNPANDPDTSRAAELGGLVRPLRTVQRAGGKAIDWRPVGSGRRRY